MHKKASNFISDLESRNVWFEAINEQEELNNAIRVRKTYLRQKGISNRIEFAYETLRYCINKKMQLFIKNFEGATQRNYDDHIANIYFPHKFCKITNVYINGLDYESWCRNKYSDSDASVNNAVKKIERIYINYMHSDEAVKSNYEKISKLLYLYLKSNLFLDLVHTIRHLLKRQVNQNA